MPAPYGITVDGFNAKTTEEVRADLDAGWKGILGDGAGTEPDGTIPLDSPEGQIITLMTDPLAELWELGEAIAASFDPNQANDAPQDALAAMTGTVRNEATYSTVSVTCVGTNGTVLPAGQRMRVPSSLAQFVSTASATITSPSGRANGAAYALGDIRYDGLLVYVCVVAGVTGFGSPGGTLGQTVVDGTVSWYVIDDQLRGAIAMPMRAVETGPIGAPAGFLTEIMTPVSGWASAYNTLDAAAGQNRESNALFRARRDAELAGQGLSTPDAIRAAVLRVNAGSVDPAHQPPTVVKVFYNDTDYIDDNGLPPHSVEVLVRNGTDADIAQAVFDSVAAGTYTHGNQTSEVVDSEGNPQVVRWSRPEDVLIYVVMVLRYDPAQWPQGSEALVAQYGLSALLTYTNDFPIARDVRLSPLNAGVMTGPSQVSSSGAAVTPAATGSSPVKGLLEVEQLYFGTTPAPTSSAQILIQSRQVAVFDSSRCTVTATTEDP